MTVKLSVCLLISVILFAGGAIEVFSQTFPRFDPLPNMEDETRRRNVNTSEVDTWDIYLRGNGLPYELCNQTLCSSPCPGAAPPRLCPQVLPQCHSGCVCTYSCEAGIAICFEINDCLETRRRHFFTRRRRKSTVPME